MRIVRLDVGRRRDDRPEGRRQALVDGRVEEGVEAFAEDLSEGRDRSLDEAGVPDSPTTSARVVGQTTATGTGTVKNTRFVVTPTSLSASPICAFTQQQLRRS